MSTLPIAMIGAACDDMTIDSGSFVDDAASTSDMIRAITYAHRS